jgi:hypothetical protein
MFIAPHSAFGKSRSFPYRTTGMSGIVVFGPANAGAAAESGSKKMKINCGIPHMGDADARMPGYSTSTLATGKQIPDVHCAPLGIRKKPLIPISDHGDERHCCFWR